METPLDLSYYSSGEKSDPCDFGIGCGFSSKHRRTNSDEAENADNIVSSAFGSLSLEDREQALNEMHGVDETPAELMSEEALQEKLAQLRTELYLLCQSKNVHNAHAFLLAEQQDSQFVFHPRFCTRFLTAADFDVQLAARNILRHFEWKLKLWGRSMLAREPHRSDLDDVEQALLRSGTLQILPQRDTAGRPIVFSIVDENERPPARNFVSYPGSRLYYAAYAIIYLISLLAIGSDSMVSFLSKECSTNR